MIPKYKINSLELTSSGIFLLIAVERPNSTFTQLLKKKVGPSKYKKGSKNTHKKGNKSNKKLKNKTSAMKKIEPGKPKKTKQFTKLSRNSFGHKKFTPLTSVINRDLKRRLIASTKKNEFDDRRAWLINIQKLASIKQEYPLKMQIVNQCISTTVEYATNFLRSIW